MIATQAADGSWAGDPFLTALVVRALGTRSVATSPQGTLILRVVDAQTAAPLAGVSGHGAVSDGSGRIVLNAWPGQNQSMTLYRYGYRNNTITYTLQAGITTDLGDVALEPSQDAAILFGAITSALDGSAVPHARLRDPQNGVHTTTDANGQYSIVLGHSALLKLEISANGFQATHAELRMELGRSHHLDHVLQPQSAEAYLAGNVIDAQTQAPLQGVTVEWASGSLVYRVTHTDSDGRYEIGPLPQQAGTLSFSRWGGYLGVHLNGVLPAHPVRQLDVELQPAASPPQHASMSGSVSEEPGGRALAGVAIRLLDPTTQVEFAATQSDPDGRFEFASLSFADVLLSARLAGYQSSEARFTLSASASVVHVTATLRRLTVSGRIVDAAGATPISGASVTLGASVVQSDPDGRFHFDAVLSGEQDLRVSAPGYRPLTRRVAIAEMVDQDLGTIALEAEVTQPELAGVVIDRNTGAPLEGATITLDATRGVRSAPDGSWSLGAVDPGHRSVRASMPGYLPSTHEVDVSMARRYAMSFELEPVASASLSLAVLPDRHAYPAYAPIDVVTAVHHQGSEPQSLVLDVALIAADGQVVGYGRYSNGSVFNVLAGRSDRLVTLDSGNLSPGRYIVESRVYDGYGNPGGGRPMIARASASIEILETRALESVHTVTLPRYANHRSNEAAAGRVRILSRSNVPVAPTLTLTLSRPDGSVAATADLVVQIPPDQRVRDVELPFGSVLFDPPGNWSVATTVSGLPSERTSAENLVTVLPGYRFDIDKKIAPGVIAPEPRRRIRIDLQLKGVQP